MRRLRIEYDGAVLFDGEVGEVTWTATDEGISVQGRVPGAPTPRQAPRSKAGSPTASFLTKLAESMAEKRAQVPPTWTDEDVNEEPVDLAEVSSTP